MSSREDAKNAKGSEEGSGPDSAQMSLHGDPGGEILLYETEDGRTRVECRFAEEMVWMSQALMADLFRTTPQNITLHPKALFLDGEIVEAATCKDYLQVRTEGSRQVRRPVKYYNLDAVLAVGYRVRSGALQGAGGTRESGPLRSGARGGGRTGGGLSAGSCLGSRCWTRGRRTLVSPQNKLPGTCHPGMGVVLM